jgi:transcription elongation factor GreA
MAVPVDLSQRAFDRLKAEYDDLTTRGRVDIARKIETARELGDLSENGDYHAAKEEQGKMEGRIAHLAQMIENANIVEADGSGQAGPGSIEEHHEDLDVISPTSALGEALRGHTVGETITYETPTGAQMSVALVAVE